MKCTPQDFKRLRERLGEGVRPNTKRQYVMYVRAMFNWAKKIRLIPDLPDWADCFANVSVDLIEQDRDDFQRDHGERRFELDDARQIIAAAQRSAERTPGLWGNNAELKMLIGSRLLLAGTLLGANCGSYSADIAALTFDRIDLRIGYINSFAISVTIVAQSADSWDRS